MSVAWRINSEKYGMVARLANDFYDAVFNGDNWTGLAQRMAETFDAPSASIHLRPDDAPVHTFDQTENLKLRSGKEIEEAAYWRARDPWIALARSRKLGPVVRGTALIPASKFERMPFFREWCEPRGVFYMLGAGFKVNQGLATLAVHRPRSGPDFSTEDEHFVRLLIPPYRGALLLRHQLRLFAIREAVANQSLELADQAAVVVTSGMRIVEIYGRAARLLRHPDGVKSEGGNLRCTDPASDLELADAVRRAAQLGKGDLDLGAAPGALRSLSLPRKSGLPLVASVVPIRSSVLSRAEAAALVLIRDPERQVPSAEILRKAFEFTLTEAQIARALTEGNSVEEICASLKVKENTVRTHIKSILAKTGTTRQGQLIAHIFRKVGGLLG